VRFRKGGTNYHRRHRETAQVVDIQLSRGSTWRDKEFYVNAGAAFDGKTIGNAIKTTQKI